MDEIINKYKQALIDRVQYVVINIALPIINYPSNQPSKTAVNDARGKDD